MCFCLFELFIAVISCLSIQTFANVLKVFCFALSKPFIALNRPIIPSCTISSLSAPIIKYFPTLEFTKSLYLFNKYTSACSSPFLISVIICSSVKLLYLSVVKYISSFCISLKIPPQAFFLILYICKA